MNNLFENNMPAHENTPDATVTSAAELAAAELAAVAAANTQPLPNSIDAIDDLIKKLQAQRQELKKASTNAALEFIMRKMTETGLSLSDIQAFIKNGRIEVSTAAVATGAVAKTKNPVAVKYVGPNGEKWSGRGIKASWVQKIISDGGDIEAYRIKK